MNTVVVTQPIHAPVEAYLRAHAEVTINRGPDPWSNAELAERLVDADAMMAFMPDRVDAMLLEAAPRLRVVACALKGFDNFDLQACRARGVTVTYVPDLLTEPTAELALGLAIGVARHIRAGDAVVRTGAFGGWRPILYGTGLHRSVVAVVGMGAVGKAIVDRLQGFGCEAILGVDPSGVDARVTMVSLEHAIASADYLIMAVPLTSRTRHLLDRTRLAGCRSGQIVINVGRGSVVDESAVLEALDSGRLSAFAADVFECEDWLLPDRPKEISPRLRSHPRALFTPHLGSAVVRVRQEIEQRAAEDIVAVLSGRRPRGLLEISG